MCLATCSPILRDKRSAKLSFLKPGRRYVPTLQLPEATSWVTQPVSERLDGLHSMLISVLAGHQSDIDDINGWIINQAHRFGIPCPRHEGIRDMAKAKAERIKKEIAAEETAKRAEIEHQQESRRSSSLDSDHEPLDKLEVKRMEKAKRQREKLGNQEMPDYTRPR
jgi:Ketopantoate reductase PanE/ApbA C terminal